MAVRNASTPKRAWTSNRAPGSHTLAVLFASVAFTISPMAASAEPLEARTYLDVDASWPLAPDHAPDLRLGPFVREESRYREDGLTFVKTFAGARMRFSPWLRAAAYYAHKDFPASDRPQAHMAVLDVFGDFHLGPLTGFDKNGFEAHVTDEFLRYRNALEVRWESPLGWLAPFARGELRVDSDAQRVNLLDAWTGLLLTGPSREHERSPLSLRLFYGYEANRRGRPDWTGVHMLGVEVGARI
jgi:hypothetical protein